MSHSLSRNEESLHGKVVDYCYARAVQRMYPIYVQEKAVIFVLELLRSCYGQSFETQRWSCRGFGRDSFPVKDWCSSRGVVGRQGLCHAPQLMERSCVGLYTAPPSITISVIHTSTLVILIASIRHQDQIPTIVRCHNSV